MPKTFSSCNQAQVFSLDRPAPAGHWVVKASDRDVGGLQSFSYSERSGVVTHPQSVSNNQYITSLRSCCPSGRVDIPSNPRKRHSQAWVSNRSLIRS